MRRSLLVWERCQESARDYASRKTMDWTTGTSPAIAEPDSYNNAWARPAGHAWSSVLDLVYYGYGLFRQKAIAVGSSYYVIDEVSHGGDINGYAAFVLALQDNRKEVRA